MEEASDTKAVLICGLTASGKSALALELTREFGGAASAPAGATKANAARLFESFAPY
jgi:DNA helicase TIP49 (TBP-interacting protein)